MDYKNVITHTVENRTCIGCGICSSVCSKRAIIIHYSEKGTFEPIVDDKCVHCGQCVKYCPNNFSLLKKLADSTKSREIYHHRGTFGGQAFLFQSDDIELYKSASGGFVTWLAKYLLEEKIIDAVIHAEPVLAKIGEPHYKVSESFCVEELDKKRSSFYAPINYVPIITKYKNTEKKLLIIGVPCALRGFKKLFTENPIYNKNKVYLAALSCSHNVTGKFVDQLAIDAGMDSKTEFYCNLRDKAGIKDANNFQFKSL